MAAAVSLNADSRRASIAAISTSSAGASARDGSTAEMNQSQINSRNKQNTFYSSSSRREYITAPGEDDSKRPLLPRSSSSSKYAMPEKSNEPIILKDTIELQQHLELMHDRCIARNLRAAGLGGFEVEDEIIYGVLDPNAHLVTGESMLKASVLYIKELDRLHHYISILLNDGADVNEQDAEGKTALMHAILVGREKAAKAIMRHDKTDLLIRDNEGNTALVHAARIGSEMMLYYFFKTLRKREKHHFHQQRQHAPVDAQKSSGSQNGEKKQNSTAASNEQEQSDNGQILWSLLRSHDPIEIQNAKGETAHMMALKHGHVECANMISDEKLKRAKEMNKRLSTINHQRGGSPSIFRFAKKSAKKCVQHYGSFDSLYFNHEDESDDELMLNQARLPRPTTPDAETIMGHRKSQPVTPQYQNHVAQRQSRHQSVKNKGILSKLNKRFQSNPDLFRTKPVVNGTEECGTHETNQATSDGRQEFSSNGNAIEISNENSIDNEPKAINVVVEKKSYQTGPSVPSHQPVIKGMQNQRRASGPIKGKRSLTEKLMTFLHIRAKPSVPSSASDMTLCGAKESSYYKEKLKKNQSLCPNFNSICDVDENGGMRKGTSIPEFSSMQNPGRGNSLSPYSATISSNDAAFDPNHRRSVDLSAIPSMRNKYLAGQLAYANDWPSENAVSEEVTDVTMVAFTTAPSPTHAPTTWGSSTVLKQ